MKANWTTVLLAACIAAPGAAALAQDATYRKDIKPLVEARCAGCHGANAPTLAEFQLDQKKYTAAMQGPRIDSYADLLMLIG